MGVFKQFSIGGVLTDVRTLRFHQVDVPQIPGMSSSCPSLRTLQGSEISDDSAYSFTREAIAEFFQINGFFSLRRAH
jgi:hypothetical protein